MSNETEKKIEWDKEFGGPGFNKLAKTEIEIDEETLKKIEEEEALKKN